MPFPSARSFNGEGDWTAYRAVQRVHLGQIHGLGRTVQKDAIVLFDGTNVEILPSGGVGSTGQAYGYRYINPGLQSAIDAGFFVKDDDFQIGLRILQDGVSISPNIDVLNFSGGVSLAVDGADLSQANVQVSGGGIGGPSSAVVSASGAFAAPASVVVGDFVYVTGNNQVDLSDSGSTIRMPALGVVISKQSLTTVTVAYSGEIDIFSGLVAGDSYFIGPFGTMTDVAPTLTGVVQHLGLAINSTTLILVADDIILL